MSTDKNKTDFDHLAKELSAESRLDTYDSSEMVLCVKCKRKNPPTRLDCLYCGAEIEISDAQRKKLKPILKKIEPHENGVNLIYLANLEEWDKNSLFEVAKMTRFERGRLRDLVAAKKKLPIARTSRSKEIELVSQRLLEMGIKTRLISDESFGFDQTVVRLSGITFLDKEIFFTRFSDGEPIEADSRDIYLIVVGAIFEQKVEATEEYSKKSENKILDTSQANADHVVFDIYLKEAEEVLRVSTNGFDFSCLGNEKGLLAIQNIKILIEKLRQVSSSVKLDDDYLKVRGLLTSVWALDEQVDLKGIKRKGLNSFSKKSITVTSNLVQFNKYSRMCGYLCNESEK